MIIGTCGFCSTGSSAVSDYLKEFEENQVLDDIEFVFPYLPDGLEDLEYHLTKSISRDESSAVAFTRFRRFMKFHKNEVVINTSIESAEYDKIVEDFISSLVQMRWTGVRRSDGLLFYNYLYRRVGLSLMQQRVIPFINSKFKKCVDLYPHRELELSVMPENFTEAARHFVSSLLLAMGADFSRNIVLDQPFTGDDPVKSFHFFEEPIAFVVDRDPRDNYIFAREFLYKKDKYMPIETVESFVKYYALLRDNRPYKLHNDKVMRLHFEDLVYNYDATTKKIREFCKLPENKRPQTIFRPERSMANTQLFRRFPKYAKDVKYIEKELEDYLFDFSKYKASNLNGQMFMGKAT